MTVQRSQPLPECSVCARPTRREAWNRNRGLCSRCRSLRPAYVPTPAEAELAEWQQTAARRGLEERERAAARAHRRMDELADRRRRRQQR